MSILSFSLYSYYRLQIVSFLLNLPFGAFASLWLSFCPAGISIIREIAFCQKSPPQSYTLSKPIIYYISPHSLERENWYAISKAETAALLTSQISVKSLSCPLMPLSFNPDNNCSAVPNIAK